MTLLQETQSLKKTPLYDRHVALGAKIVDFSGWAMPVYYTGIIQEHRHVRSACCVFDVSHLGEIHIKGKGAFQFLQQRLTNDLQKLSDGKILYSLLCDEKGGTLDDILIYQENRDDYYLIVNAGSIERDYAEILKYAPDDLSIKNLSDEMACIAIQGPNSEEILETLFHFDLKNLGYYYFKNESYQNSPVWVSRSGYTGEDGFEIFSPNHLAPSIWDTLISRGKAMGVLPAGLGARNTLRLEAGNVLYGHELSLSITPLEAGLQWAVSFKKENFVGRDILWRQKEQGLKRKLVGFKMLDKPIARDGYLIYKDAKKVGQVSSGSYGPSVDQNIGLGFVEPALTAPGTQIEIEIHGRLVKAEVVKLPFIAMKHKR